MQCASTTTSSFPVRSDRFGSSFAAVGDAEREARLGNLLNFILARGVKLSRILAKLAVEAKCILSSNAPNDRSTYRFTEIETHAISPDGDFNRFVAVFTVTINGTNHFRLSMTSVNVNWNWF